MAHAAFDHMAFTYDGSFTNSAIGKWQRSRVWNYLGQQLDHTPGRQVLELNCGTGEDAIRFAQLGWNVLATDVSPRMLEVTSNKVKENGLQERVATAILDLNLFHPDRLDQKYDLVFSNFAGLNCLQPRAVEHLLYSLHCRLNPGGRVIAVFLPKNCLWELAYFFAKGKAREALRRWQDKPVAAALDEASVDTWYYNPDVIEKWADSKYRTVNILPVGLTIPPSYLEKFFSRRQSWLDRLGKFENRFGNKRFLARFADHYLIDLEARN